MADELVSGMARSETILPRRETQGAKQTVPHVWNQLLEVCNTMNDNKFIIKFVVNDPNVWCSYEFKPNKDITSDDFDTIFLQLDKATDELYEKLSK